MKEHYNWGILGPGKIAHKFAQGLSVTGKGHLYAVGSRDSSRARSFASLYKAEKAYGSYEELVSDPDIDIIYIATPHHLHYEMTRLCFDNDKNVLCEKPACMNQSQFEELREIATKKELFYMEALWTRFLPGINHALSILPEIGEIKSIRADFGFRAPYDVSSRIFNPDLGGGSTLDIGIYTIFMALLFMGYPDEIIASAIIGKTGVDETTGYLFKYNSGAMAFLSSTFLGDTITEAEVSGSKGQIHFASRFFTPTSVEITRENQEKEVLNFKALKNGYEYEAIECMRCMDESLLQSPVLPHSFTSDLIKIMDEIRRQIGLKYFCDK